MKKKHLVIVFAIIAFIFLILFIMPIVRIIQRFNELGELNITDTSYTLKKGSIELLNVKTNKIDTISLGGIKLINFWAPWCKPCIEEVPSLQRLQEMNRSIHVLQFSFDSLRDQKRIIHNHSWSLPAYYISDTSLFEIPDLLPTTYLIKDSFVIKRYWGSQDWNNPTLVHYIDSIVMSSNKHL